MKKRNIFIIALAIGIVFALLTIISALVGSRTINHLPATEDIASFPVNSIIINPDESLFYNYAGITANDTITLATESGETLIATLDKKNWKNIAWAPSAGIFVVLGESEPNVFDLYLYNVLEKSWKQLTNYSFAASGVTGFTWVDNSRIFFVQGDGQDRWLHRLNLDSTELLKIKRVPESEIIGFSKPDQYILLYDNQNIFAITDTGEILFESPITEMDLVISLNPLFFDGKAILNTYSKTENSAKFMLLDTKTNETTFENFTYALCSLDEENILVSNEETNLSRYYTYNIKNKNSNLVQTFAWNMFNLSCGNFKAFIYSGTNWLEFKNQSFIENNLLDEFIEISIR